MPTTSSGRVVALDAFRGLTVAFMILVNWPGSEADAFWPLLHSPWNGCTPTDLVFPFFVFIAGASAWFSFKKYAHLLTAEAFGKIVRRSSLIFLVGLLLNMFPFCHINWITMKVTPTLTEPEFWENLRILGVLQRIALAYGVGVFFCLAFRGRMKAIALVSGALLLIYWMLFYICPNESAPLSLESNITRKLDLLIFGAAHLYHGELYHGMAFDPESLLGTISAAATVMLGFMAGKAVDPEENGDFSANPDAPTICDTSIAKLLLGGTVLLALAWFWNFWFPINKPLWSSSYVLWTAGLAMVFLSWFVWLIDLRHHEGLAKPLIVFGMNPLFLYVLAWCLYDTLMQWLFTRQGYVDFYNGVLIPAISPAGASLVIGLAFVFVIWLVGCILSLCRIYIRL